LLAALGQPGNYNVTPADGKIGDIPHRQGRGS